MIILKGTFEQFHQQGDIRRHRNRNDPIRVIKGFYLALRSLAGHDTQPAGTGGEESHTQGGCLPATGVESEAGTVGGEGFSLIMLVSVLFGRGHPRWTPSCQEILGTPLSLAGIRLGGFQTFRFLRAYREFLALDFVSAFPAPVPARMCTVRTALSRPFA